MIAQWDTPGLWWPASNGNNKRHWFLVRDNMDGSRDYCWNAAGNLTGYASYRTAQKAADRLNSARLS